MDRPPWEGNAASFVNAIGATMGPLLGVILDQPCGGGFARSLHSLPPVAQSPRAMS